MELRPSRVSIQQFSYFKDNRHLCAEISDLGPGFEFGQVYDDACDVGLTVIDGYGKEGVFYVEKEQRDDEGELQEYILLPTPETIRRIPKLKGVAIVLFND